MSGYNIGDDLLVEIFERLPPKSIIRFRSFSQYWHSRLLSPEFLNSHRLRCSKNPPKVIVRHVTGREYYKRREIYTLHSPDQLPFVDPVSRLACIPGVEFPYVRKVSVIGSYNGILCMCLYDNDEEVISLWNFSIRRKLIVPRRPPSKTNFSKVALGFGFDSITDDYNIVAICYNEYALEENRTLIYSLKTDSWGAIPSPPNRLSHTYVMPKACFFNGILHWVGHGYSTLTHEGCTRFILAFNLSSRVFGYILLPKSWRVEHVTTINSCLAVVHPENNSFWEDGYTWIRVMKEYGTIESWSSLFKLKNDAFNGLMTVFQPIINGDILAYIDVECSKVYNYNAQTNVTKHLEFGTDCCKYEMDIRMLKASNWLTINARQLVGKPYSFGPKRMITNEQVYRECILDVGSRARFHD
ncbi:F-box/kelch-repeat protein At3g23880-like [Bidens hawaiensis]|uniref:F-box/kelch-repeat protein At3g23880-like n=1 Tax=Bidens hawaiensis TaxID=980011 RepID=UPI00404AF5B7